MKRNKMEKSSWNQGITKKNRFGLLTVTPVSLMMILFIIIPLAYIVFISFMTRGTYGGIKLNFTLENYRNIFDPLYFKVIFKSSLLSFVSTILCIIIGYPVAYNIAMRSKRTASLLILVIAIPFWTSSMARLYAFVILMNASGIINKFLMNLGLIRGPIQMLYNSGAVIIGMVYCLLPFAILPLYTSIEKLDKSLLEASNDLGASAVKTFIRVTLPLTSPGIFASVILVFIPSLGYYYVTDIMGGGTSLVMGTLVKQQFTTAKNWPFGAAISLFLILITIFILFRYSKKGNLDDLGVR
jgi:spermidine/putrescine transport system permease protein